MANNQFTVKEGLKVQKEHLNRWRKVLKPLVFKLLDNYIKKVNAKLTVYHTGYDVPRGTDIDGLVANYQLGHKFGSVYNKIRLK